MTIGVNDPCAGYLAMQPDWEICRTLLGGTRAMRAAGTAYLPKFRAESEENYTNRLNKTVLTNYFRKILDDLVGKPFSKPMVLGDDVPREIAGTREGRNGQAGGGWVEDIDLAGNHLQVFAREVFRTALCRGLTHILVDSTGSGRAKTKAEEAAEGVRPYLVHVPPENLIGWRWEARSGKPVLTQVRIRETGEEPDGEFGMRTVTRVRVLTPGAYQVFAQNGKGDWAPDPERSGGTSLDFIPLVTFHGERTGFMTGRPPLLDLAYLNVAHWQSSSDQRNILTTSRFAMLAASGYNQKSDGEVVVGPNRVLMTENPQGKWYYVEPTGSAIAAGRQDLEDLKQEMALAGLAMLMARPGNATATARALDTAEADSSLQSLARGLGDALEQALQFMARWAGLPGGGSVVINSDFGLSLEQTQDIQNLINLRNNGDLSQATLWAELKRRGVLADDFDAELEATRLQDEGAPFGEDMAA